MKDILCPTDLSELGSIALDHAVHIAAALQASVTLLHVAGPSEQQGEAAAHVEQVLENEMARVKDTVPIKHMVVNGQALPAIAHEAAHGHALMVAGTHGPRGLRQKLFGADILDLVQHAGIPSLVVQKDSPVRNFDRIVMPVAGHADIHALVDAVVDLATAFDAEVEIYQVDRPGEAPSEHLLANKARMRERLTTAGVRHKEVSEEPTVYSIGFAQQTIAHAQKVGAGLIAIMAHASEEYRYIAQAEKERMLMNEALIPVLCC